MKLNCPHCGAPVAAADINVQALIAVCATCDEVFSFGTPPVARKRKLRKLNPPEGVQAHVQADRLTLTYDNRIGQGQFLALLQALVVVFVWIGNVAMWALSNLPLGVILGIGSLTVLASYIYIIAASINAVTEIEADSMSISVKQGPLPFPGRHECRVEAENMIDILYRSSDENSPRWWPGYKVVAEMHEGQPVTIVPGLQRDMARFIAHTLDDFLRTVEVEADAYVLDAAPDVVIETDDGELDPALLADEARRTHSTR